SMPCATVSTSIDRGGRPMAHNTFHVALYVEDLEAATARYRKPLGQEPRKGRRDYAKFEITDPPVILSLNVGGEPGTVSHLGIRYPGTGDVASEMVRVKHEAVDLLEQKGTTCCYAKADKFWVRDADGMQWEMYTLLEDAEAETAADQTLRRFLDQDLAPDPRSVATIANGYTSYWQECHAETDEVQRPKTCRAWCAARERGQTVLETSGLIGSFLDAATYNNLWRAWGALERPPD